MIDPAQLTRDLGGTWHRSYGTAPCPVCQTERRRDQNALTVRADGQRLLLHCKKSHCDFKHILTASGIRPGHVEVDAMAAENARREREAEAARTLSRARSMWDAGQPIEGTKGESYLRGRGITCPLPDSLRWRPDIYHSECGKYLSAMIGNVTSGGVHRTFFTKQGVRLDKATGSTKHKMAYGPCGGGAVRLSEAIGPLVVCEGIETGLSLLSGPLSGPHTVWAALSTSGVQGLRLPSNPGDLIIAPDNDKNGAGEIAANKLAVRANALGWRVSLMVPPDGCNDWNDVLQSGVAA